MTNLFLFFQITIIYKVFSFKLLLTTLETNHSFCWQGIVHVDERNILPESSCIQWIVGQLAEYLVVLFYGDPSSCFLFFFKHCLCKNPPSVTCCCGLEDRKPVHGFSSLFAVELVIYGFQCSPAAAKASEFFSSATSLFGLSTQHFP